MAQGSIAFIQLEFTSFSPHHSPAPPYVRVQSRPLNEGFQERCLARTLINESSILQQRWKIGALCRALSRGENAWQQEHKKLIYPRVSKRTDFALDAPGEKCLATC